MRKRMFFIVPAALIGMALLAFLGGEIVKLLWNWLTPPLFGWHAITFWQAFGLLALCRILFGGFRLHGPGRAAGWRMRHRMRERWEQMTPEERERFRAGMRGRCGWEGAEGEWKNLGGG